ncbi:WD40-repeat-containing domain protein [Dipodascopsis uninucleata]
MSRRANLLGETASSVLSSIESILSSHEFASVNLEERQEIYRRIAKNFPTLYSNPGRTAFLENVLNGDVEDAEFNGHDPLEVLPYEIVLRIVSYCSALDVLTAMRVKKSWNRFMRDMRIWQNLYHQKQWSINKDLIDLLSSYIVRDHQASLVEDADKNLSASAEDIATVKELCDLPSKNSIVTSFYCMEPTGRDSPSTKRGRWINSINWLYLYKIRHMLDANWDHGNCWLGRFPSHGHRVQESLISTVGVNEFLLDTAYQLGLTEHMEDQNEVGFEWESDGGDDISINDPVFPSHHLASIYAVQFDNKYLFSASKDSTIKMWDFHRGTIIDTFRGHSGSVLCLQFDTKEDLLVSGGADGKIILWSIGKSKILSVLNGHAGRVMDVGFNDKYIISGSQDRTIRVWDKNAPHVSLRVLEGYSGFINRIGLHNNLVVSGSGDHTVRLWNVEAEECVTVFKDHTRGVAAVSFDGKIVASGGSDRTVRLYNIDTGECDVIENAHSKRVRSLQYSNGTLVTGSYDGTIKCWIKKEEPGRRWRWVLRAVLSLPRWMEGTMQVFSLQFDHRRIVASTVANTIICYDFGKSIEGIDALDRVFHKF